MKVCPHCGGSYPVAEGFCPMDGTRLRARRSSGAQVSEPDEDARALIGRILDQRYRIEEWIGGGAVGMVYRVTHVVIGKSFALKVLRAEHRDSDEVVHRFLTEARVASTLEHPNVVGINDFGELPEGGAYYVMDLLAGESLATTLDTHGPLPPAEACAIARQIAAGLGAAHAQGVVHRDLKPDNVFLCSTRAPEGGPLVKLLDFGIARAGSLRVTVQGVMLGTLEYMSPEMIRGQEVDGRADLYALGVILFEMLTGTVPFFSEAMAKVLEMHLFAEVPSLASRHSGLAAADLHGLERVLGRLLAKAPEQRFLAAQEVVDALAVLAGDETRAPLETAAPRTTRIFGSEGGDEIWTGLDAPTGEASRKKTFLIAPPGATEGPLDHVTLGHTLAPTPTGPLGPWSEQNDPSVARVDGEESPFIGLDPTSTRPWGGLLVLGLAVVAFVVLGAAYLTPTPMNLPARAAGQGAAGEPTEPRPPAPSPRGAPPVDREGVRPAGLSSVSPEAPAAGHPNSGEREPQPGAMAADPPGIPQAHVDGHGVEEKTDIDDEGDIDVDGEFDAALDPVAVPKKHRASTRRSPATDKGRAKPLTPPAPSSPTDPPQDGAPPPASDPIKPSTPDDLKDPFPKN